MIDDEGDAQRQQKLVRYSANCIRPAVDYLLRQFNHQDSELYSVVKALKTARLCSPVFTC